MQRILNCFVQLLRVLALPFVIVGRIIFWLLFALAALLFVRHLSSKSRRAGAVERSRPAQGKPTHTPQGKPIEDMVACARCGLLLPESESVKKSGQHFCCSDHAR